MNDKPGESANSGGPEQDVSAAQGAEAAQNGQASAQQLAELKAENAELRDRLLRSAAEMENIRRRTEREKADTSKYAITEFARDAVSIGDNLRRAIEAAHKEPLDSNPALKTLLEGVEVTERDLFKVLERHGITRFDPKGEKFDPHLHEAMVKVDWPGAAADEVVQVLHAGYKIADRVLRPAAVIVAKGGMPAQPAQPEQALASPRPEPLHPHTHAHTEVPLEFPRAHPEHANDDLEGLPRARASSMTINVMGAEAHDPDVLRGPRGAPKGPHTNQQGRGNRPWPEKRGPSVTRPISEDIPHKKDDLVSSFGKRPDKDESR
jgi:molecular chaperone GrpE